MSELSFYTFPDGEESNYWDPIVSTVQGSLSEERRASTGRYGKDQKEFNRVRKLNSKFRLSLYEIITSTEETIVDKGHSIRTYTERLSHLGASYPEVANLEPNLYGLRNLEGKNHWKKVFDLLAFIAFNMKVHKPIELYYIMQKIGTILINDNTEGRFKENTKILFQVLSQPELAQNVVMIVFNFNRGALDESLQRGERLSKQIYLQVYSNTNSYRSKVRRRGYARQSPVRPISEKLVLEANYSTEVLEAEGKISKYDDGGYYMNEQEKKPEVEELIFQSFQNALKSYTLWQEEFLKQQEQRKNPGNISQKEEIEDKESEQ